MAAEKKNASEAAARDFAPRSTFGSSRSSDADAPPVAANPLPGARAVREEKGVLPPGERHQVVFSSGF